MQILGAGEMPEQVKALDAKPEDMSWVQFQMVEGEDLHQQVQQVVLWFSHICHGMLCPYTHVHPHSKWIENNLKL